MGLTLVMVGAVIAMAVGIYAMSRPRAKGEPFDTTRKIWLALTILGLLLCLWGAALLFAEI